MVKRHQPVDLLGGPRTTTSRHHVKSVIHELDEAFRVVAPDRQFWVALEQVEDGQEVTRDVRLATGVRHCVQKVCSIFS